MHFRHSLSPCHDWQNEHIGLGFPGGSAVKNPPVMQEMQVLSPDQEDPLEQGRTPHSSILAWRITRAEEPGGLQSTGSLRVGHD